MNFDDWDGFGPVWKISYDVFISENNFVYYKNFARILVIATKMYPKQERQRYNEALY